MINKVKGLISARLKNERGQGMVEYALLIGLVSIVVIAVLIFLGPEIAKLFQKIIDSLKAIP